MKLTIRSKQYLTNEVVAISFDEKPWQHKSGQFLTFRFNDDNQVIRSYSLVNRPGESYTIWVKRIPNGSISNWFYHKAQVGDTIDTEPPAGRFCLDHQDLPETLVLSGAGSGVAPLIPLLYEAAELDNIKQIVWLESASNFDKSLSLEYLKDIQLKIGDRLRITFFITQAKVDRAQNLRISINKGYLSNTKFEDWLRLEQLTPKTSQFFICGPEALMRLQRFELKLKGWADDQIRQEQFLVKPVQTPQSLHYEPQPAVVTVNGNEHRFTVATNQTLLDAGLQAGLKLPYSCKSGQCSACIAKLTTGNVNHLVNEVLTTRDLDAGYMLPCQARPQSPVKWKYE